MADALLYLYIGVFVINVAWSRSSSVVDRQEIQVCYGKDLFLQCSEKTKIYIQNLEYGVKVPSKTCPSNQVEEQNSTCCTYSQGDCTLKLTSAEAVTYYTFISGYGSTKLQKRVNWQRMDNCTIGREYSNYIILRYKCISDSDIQIMTTQGSVFGNTVYGMYPPKGSSVSRDLCVCTVSTTNGPGMDIFALDIRLQSESIEANLTCVGNHSLIISDKTRNETFVCEDDVMLRNDFQLFSTNEESAKITFERDTADRPQIVWFGVTAKDANSDVVLSCNSPEVTSQTAHKPSSNLSSSVAPSSSPSTQDDNQTTITIIILAVVGVVVIIILIIIVVVVKRRRESRDQQKEQAFREYRRKMQQSPSDGEVDVKQSRRPRDPLPKRNDGDVNKEKTKSPQNVIKENQHKKDNKNPRRPKLKLNSPTGMDVIMDDPVYHNMAFQRNDRNTKQTSPNKKTSR